MTSEELLQMLSDASALLPEIRRLNQSVASLLNEIQRSRDKPASVDQRFLSNRQLREYVGVRSRTTIRKRFGTAKLPGKGQARYDKELVDRLMGTAPETDADRFRRRLQEISRRSA